MTGSHEPTPMAADENAMPSMEELRAERLELLKQIRHHKDGQDSVALDIENQPGTADVYRRACRVLFVEHFAHRAAEYVEDMLPDEISRVVAADEINTEKRMAIFIKELQRKREHILKKISAIQDRFDKRSDPAQWYLDAVESKYAAQTEDDKKVVKHTLQNEEEIERLEAEVSKLKEERCAATAQLLMLNRDAERRQLHLRNSVKKTELENTVHARQCREMNVANSQKVGGLQVTMNLINTEHYGAGQAPSSKDLKEQLRIAEDNADEDYLLVEPKDITEEDLERLQSKKGKKKEKKEKKDKKKKDD